MKTLLGAVMSIPELGKRVYLNAAPVGTTAPAAVYAVVYVQPGGPLLEVHDQGDPNLPSMVMQDYQRVTLFDSMRSGDNFPGDVTQRLMAITQKVLAAAKAVDTDIDGVTPISELRLRWRPRPVADDRVANGQYVTIDWSTRSVI